MLNRPCTAIIATPLRPMHDGSDSGWPPPDRRLGRIAAPGPAATASSSGR